MIKPMTKLAKLLGYTVTYHNFRKGKQYSYSTKESNIGIHTDFKNMPIEAIWSIANGIAHLVLPTECDNNTFSDFSYELNGRMFNSLFGYSKPKTILTKAISGSLIHKCRPEETSNILSNIKIGKNGLIVVAE